MRKRVLEALRQGPGTSRELAELLGVPTTRAHEALVRMHKRGAIYVREWRPHEDAYIQRPSQVWAIGKRKDAPKPEPQSYSETRKRYRARHATKIRALERKPVERSAAVFGMIASGLRN